LLKKKKKLEEKAEGCAETWPLKHTFKLRYSYGYAVNLYIVKSTTI